MVSFAALSLAASGLFQDFVGMNGSNSYLWNGIAGSNGTDVWQGCLVALDPCPGYLSPDPGSCSWLDWLQGVRSQYTVLIHGYERILPPTFPPSILYPVN